MNSPAHTVAIADELAEMLETFRQDRGVSESIPAVVDAALRQYLRTRGYIPAGDDRPLRLTPDEHGSGHADVSLEHDHYLYEAPE